VALQAEKHVSGWVLAATPRSKSERDSRSMLTLTDASMQESACYLKWM
jgi:hypothetical protein